MTMKQKMGRHLSFVECRESMGLGVGGGLAQRATISESGSDVVAIAMGPGRRHITKPVCEITYALREEGIDTSVLVVNAGSGVPADAPDVTTGSCFGLDPIEVDRIQQYKVALIHLGNVRNHIIYKARLILRNVDIPAIVVAQCPVDYEDFALRGLRGHRGQDEGGHAARGQDPDQGRDRGDRHRRHQGGHHAPGQAGRDRLQGAVHAAGA